MANYETEEPRGLWEDICRARRMEAQAKPDNRKGTVVWRLWSRRLAAVAAMGALVFSVGYLAKEGEEFPPASPTAASVNITDAKGKEYAAILSEEITGKPAAAAGSTCLGTSEEALSAATALDVPPSTEMITDTISTASKSIPEAGQHLAEGTPDTHQHQQRHHDKNKQGTYTPQYVAAAHIGSDNSGKLSFGVFMSGSTSSALNKNSTGDFLAGTGSEDSNWEDCPLADILLYNQGKEVKTDIKHRLPIRAGISLAYKINERVSLESGLTYANLTSDMREGSDSYYFTGEQTLHYVGIPLNVRYELISWKGLEVYASSGLLAEKCVSGKLEKEYVLNHQVEKKETQDLDEKPLQWSVNASAGLQYNISPSVGLYAEPDVSYYFKDGTSIKTIYKDKPLNFNLNLGIRFTFGNK